MSDARTWLKERQALASKATEGPWAAWTDQDGQPHMNHMLMVGNAAAVIPEGEWWVEGVDVNPTAHTYTPEDRAFIVDARTSVPRMAGALTAVLDLHRPMGIYSMEHGDCDHADPEACPPVETDAGTMCGVSPDYYACEACMDAGGELRDDYPRHPCDTVRAAEAALGGEE